MHSIPCSVQLGSARLGSAMFGSSLKLWLHRGPLRRVMSEGGVESEAETLLQVESKDREAIKGDLVIF